MSSKCPICQKKTEPACTPFCSPRCREVDMNRWFTGSYAVPAVELDDVDPHDLEALDEGAEKPGH